MSVNQIVGAKLMPECFVPLLNYRDGKILCLVGPVGIADPDPVLAGAWNLNVLINSRLRFIGASRCGIPAAFSTLSPFGRGAGSIHAPSWRFRARQV